MLLMKFLVFQCSIFIHIHHFLCFLPHCFSKHCLGKYIFSLSTRISLYRKHKCCIMYRPSLVPHFLALFYVPPFTYLFPPTSSFSPFTHLPPKYPSTFYSLFAGPLSFHPLTYLRKNTSSTCLFPCCRRCRCFILAGILAMKDIETRTTGFHLKNE